MFETDRLPAAALRGSSQDSAASRGPDPVEELARALRARYGDYDAPGLLEAMIGHEFAGWIAGVSSFGAEAAVLLDLIARIDRATPVIFLDTGKLFPETLDYRDALVERLGLTDVRNVVPDPAALAAHDPVGDLWQCNPDACCHLRKVAPLETALAGFDAWITGRKRYQGGEREALETIEAVGGRIKINPLAHWSRDDVEAYHSDHDLPRHPLAGQGFASIGCQPCTHRIEAGEEPRAGRWANREKTECGIHRSTGMQYREA
ncbi:MAG: phosphoadenylyl-sulfate reductase [Proteobacteria bacterium]|nr:phosphoadenylyl-sulfate reductase [Pseudomonadota bacterium]